MGIFNKFKKEKSDYNKIIMELGREVITLYLEKTGKTSEQITELEKQAISDFLFGMFNGVKILDKRTDINVEQIADGTSEVLTSLFNLSQDYAETMVTQMLVNCQAGDKQDLHYAIIHKGVDGYAIWKENKDETIGEIIRIVSIILSKTPKEKSDFDNIIMELGQEVITLYLEKTGKTSEQITKLEKQAISDYLFGMFSGVKILDKLTDIEVEQIASGASDVLASLFNFSHDYAETMVTNMVINFQTGDKQNAHYIIIHEGLDGYAIWKENKDETIGEIMRIVSVLED